MARKILDADVTIYLPNAEGVIESQDIPIRIDANRVYTPFEAELFGTTYRAETLAEVQGWVRETASATLGDVVRGYLVKSSGSFTEGHFILGEHTVKRHLPHRGKTQTKTGVLHYQHNRWSIVESEGLITDPTAVKVIDRHLARMSELREAERTRHIEMRNRFDAADRELAATVLGLPDEGELPA